MAHEYRNGDLHLFGSKQPCETADCEEETNAAIWIVNRWRWTCEEHQSEVQNDLRQKGMRGL